MSQDRIPLCGIPLCGSVTKNAYSIARHTVTVARQALPNRVRRLLWGAVPFLTLLALSTAAQAAWVPRGPVFIPGVGQVPTFLDTNTGYTWTVTLGRVPSADGGQGAANSLAAAGFRLPTFGELRDIYNLGGGGPVLGIRNGLLDFYETADPNILANAFGNGFQTPQPRLGLGFNWYLGVRP